MDTPHGFPYQLTQFPLDRFQMVELLGRGGMGRVYKARDRHLNRMVALKVVVDPEVPLAVTGLLAEAQYLAALDHPHVVKVHEVGIWEGSVCLVMQFVQGTTLDRATQGLGLRTSLRLLAQAAHGVHAAHLQGFLHRDLKPQNILVEERELGEFSAYVMDFGLARRQSAESCAFSGRIAGTPHYMSPEQAAGGYLLDVRGDVYGLGATLYYLLAGHAPFAERKPPEPPPSKGATEEDPSTRREAFLPSMPEEALEPRAPVDPEAPHALAVLHRVLEEEPHPLRLLVPSLPLDLDTIVTKAMEKQPHLRYPTAEALAQDLERFLAGEPIQARRPSPVRRLQTWVRHHPTWSVALALGMTLSLVGGGVAVWAARRARARVDLAARFDGHAREMAYRIRLSALSPLHDRTPELQWLRQRAKELAEEARRAGAMAEGPMAFVQGQALTLEGRRPQALFHLRRAWDLGHRSPALAEALGTALLLASLDEVKELTLAGRLTPALARDLARTHQDPALAVFRTARDTSPLRTLVSGWIDFLERRDTTALQAAAASPQEVPGVSGPRRLNHLVPPPAPPRLELEAPAFEDHCARAWEALEQALARAHADPELWVTQGEWIITETFQRTRRGAPPSGRSYPEAIAACTQALRIDPHHVPALLARSQGWHQLAWQAYDEDPVDGAPGISLVQVAQNALDDARRAYAIDPEQLDCTRVLGWALVAKALGEERHARPMRPPLEEALALAAQGLQRDPHHLRLLNLDNNIRWHLARARIAAGEDPSPEVREAIHRLEARMVHFPEAPEVRYQCALHLQRLANLDFRRGDGPGALAQVARAREVLQGVFEISPDLRYFHGALAQVWMLEGKLRGLQGENPRACFQAAEVELRQAQEGSPMSQAEVHVELALARAQLDLEEGHPTAMAPARALLKTLGARTSLGISGRAALLRLEALAARRAGRDFRPLLAQARALLRPRLGPTLERSDAYDWGLLGALELLGGQASGRERLKAALAREPRLGWDFSFEKKM